MQDNVDHPKSRTNKTFHVNKLFTNYPNGVQVSSAFGTLSVDDITIGCPKTSEVCVASLETFMLQYFISAV
jgi:hypothetical protein